MRLLALLLSLPALVQAHHSFSEYDQGRKVEISGTLREIAWQNPHVRLKVVSELSGRQVIWDVECHSVSVLIRSNVSLKALQIGDKVKVAGNPSKASPTRLFGTNLLTPSGIELVMAPNTQPRWQVHAPAFSSFTAGDATGQPPTKGLFKVWGTSFEDPETAPTALWSAVMPLTAAARKALAAWDPVHGSVARGCTPKGMPTIMEQPYAMQFEDHGATIVLRIEEYDTVRTTHMGANAASPPQKSLLGYSVGRWDGESLVVSTHAISWPYITSGGLPQGPASRLEERFTPAADGKRLSYTLTITDPDTFTMPAVLKRAWVWWDKERVRKYACGAQQNER